METSLSLPDEVDGQNQSFGLTAQPTHQLSRESTNPVASILAGLCSGDSGELGEGQQALNLTPELLAQITAALSSNLVSTNSAATQTEHAQQELAIPDTSVSPQTSEVHLPSTLPHITGDLSQVLQQDVSGFNDVILFIYSLNGQQQNLKQLLMIPRT